VNLLLLTSALALSFVPLKSNDLTEITVEVGTVTYDTEESKLKVIVTSSDEVTAGNAFELALFETIDGEDEVIARVDIEDQLDGEEGFAEFELDLATVKADLEAIYIDIIETEDDDGTVTTRSMLDEERIPVGFAKLDGAVTYTATTTGATFTITLDKDLTDPLTDTKFVFNGEEIAVAAVTGQTKKCTVTLTKEKLLAASSTTGYIKGNTLITTTLPFSLFAKPDFTLEHVDATKTHATANEATAPAKVWLVNDGTAAELTKVTGKDYYAILYAKLDDAVVYYTDTNGIMTSNKLDISLSEAPTAPTVTFVKGASAAVAPKAKLTFDTALPYRRLAMDSTPAATPVDVSTAAPEVELEKFVGTAGCYIVLDGAVPKSLPTLLPEAVLTQTAGTKGDTKHPMNFVLTTLGFMEAAPAGILVHAKEEEDKTKAKYYAFAWDQTNANKAVAEVVLADWAKVTVRDVESYVCPDYTTMPDLEDAVKLTEAVKVKTGVIPKVTVGTPTFVAATYKVTVKVTSDADVHEEQDMDYTIAAFDLASAGVELLSEDVKASLDKTEKTVTIELDQAKFLGKSSFHLDILQTPKGGDALSVVNPAGRIAVTFAAKSTIEVETDEDDLVFTITLDKDLTNPLTKTKFVFDGEELPVAAVTGSTKKFTVTIPIADVLAAESTTGYVKGETFITSTLPFALFTATPEVTLEHKDVSKAEATFPSVPTGNKVYLKSGTADAELLTLTSKKCDIAYEKLAEAVIYYTDADGVLTSNKKDITLPEFTAPTKIEWIASEEEEEADSNDAVITHTVKFTFDEETADRKLYITATPARAAIDLSDEEAETTPAKLVGTAGYYIVVDEDDVPLSLPLAFEEAAFTQTAGTVADKKVPVTVAITPGLLKAEPAGLLVHATEETDKTKMKFYAFEWDLEEANTASASVDVDDFKTITDKDIESYVAPDYSEEIAATPVKLSEKLVVIKKKEPVEPEPKDEGAFGQMVSIMAVLLSLFVFAL